MLNFWVRQNTVGFLSGKLQPSLIWNFSALQVEILAQSLILSFGALSSQAFFV